MKLFGLGKFELIFTAILVGSIMLSVYVSVQKEKKKMANPICPVCKKEITFLFAICKVCKKPVHGGCFDTIEGAKKINSKTCKICNKDVYMGAGI